MNKAIAGTLNATLKRILLKPTVADLWQLQAELLEYGGDTAKRARAVAGEFHSCLRTLESKVASRGASRWGAILAAAAVTSVGLQEMIAQQKACAKRFLGSALATALEIGGAAKNVEAWEVEAALMYYDLAWYLYGELWEISLAMRPELPSGERRQTVQELVKPIMDKEVPEATKSALLVSLFQMLLAAHVSLLTAAEPAQ